MCRSELVAENNSEFDWQRLAIAGTGFGCAVLGAAVLAMWILPLRTPLISWSKAMPNAALGLFLDGLALVAIAWRRDQLALIGAAWSLLLGTATLAEYVFSVDLYIDRALIHNFVGRSAFPGRIGPNVAFGFVLTGAVLWWASERMRQWKWIGAMGLLSAVVFATGAASVFGYLTGLPSHGWWVQVTPRIGALDAAIGFALLGSGLLLVVWRRDSEQEARFSSWLLAAVAAGGLTVALCFGHALSALNLDRTTEIAREAGWDPEEVAAVVQAVQGNLPIMLAGIGVLVTFLMVLMANQTLASRRQALKLADEIRERRKVEAALTRKAAELEHSNSELRDFAHIASHDLQEPLRPIASFSQLLADRYRGKLDADADEFIRYLVQGAMRLQALIDGLLTYSRFETRPGQFTATDSAAVLNDALANLSVALRDTGGEVTHNPLPMVRADPAQLCQVFQNLIGNALKFHGAEKPKVHISADRASGAWHFSVRDNGIGIDAQFADKIFVMFQRLHSGEEYPGTGVGLAICKKIVERHGGKIWVKSEPGRGSTFWFSIPAGGEEIAEPRQEAPEIITSQRS